MHMLIYINNDVGYIEMLVNLTWGPTLIGYISLAYIARLCMLIAAIFLLKLKLINFNHREIIVSRLD